jgi:hypothetical protein
MRTYPQSDQGPDSVVIFRHPSVVERELEAREDCERDYRFPSPSLCLSVRFHLIQVVLIFGARPSVSKITSNNGRREKLVMKSGLYNGRKRRFEDSNQCCLRFT